MPTAIFGPGHLHLAHSANEWIAIDDVLTAAKIYAAIMLED
ncbi:hypothetical protein ACFLWY_05710 [Chloroflexota bacterium]